MIFGRGRDYRIGMSLSVIFNEARLKGMALAKIGNPLRKEPLQTSKTLCQFHDEDAELLTHCFLKPFRTLELHEFTDLDENALFKDIGEIFEDTAQLVEKSASISRHLYSSSNHPSIKSGDLCVALLDEILVDGVPTRAICLIKSESKVPFLQVAVIDGDLQLTTQRGIYPDKIDKGCLILDHGKADGYAVYLFDKSGNTQFWNREFVKAIPTRNDDFLTRRYSEMCVAFADTGVPEDGMKEERVDVAKRAVSYLSNSEEFDLDEMKKEVLEEPELIEEFSNFKKEYEETEVGLPLDESFTVAKKEAKKAERKLNSRMKLDVGVDMRFSTGFQKAADNFLEKGFDEERDMKYVKIWYHGEK